MVENELRMKLRGEAKVWKNIKTKSGSLKKISSTQIGSQILFDESLRILPLIKKWISEDSASVYRKELEKYFKNEDIILQKILESFLILASSSFIQNINNDNRTKINTRHRKIIIVRKKIMPELSFDLVWRFLEVIVNYSEYFEIKKNLIYKNSKALWSIRYECTLPEVIYNKLSLEAYFSFFPEPMLNKPIDWNGVGSDIVGGYQDFQYQMVRTPDGVVNYDKYSDSIFDAVNFIQRVPWKINIEILEQIKKDLKLPLKEDFIKSIYPDKEECRWDVDLKSCKDISDDDIEKIRLARKKFNNSVELYNAEAGDYESALGKYRAVELAIGIAEHYIEDRDIYFPHSYDFRGRIYPIPVGLSPQGSDAVKAMLKYSNTTVLTKSGENWCWAYLASLYGDDKIPFKERVERGKELIDTDYKKADEPYQFLAHQLEMRKYVEDNNYKVHSRIHLDACNSGSQFTSAITGDIYGCIATNVIPTINEDESQDRKDVYLLVSDKALSLTKSLIKTTLDKDIKKSLNLFKTLLQESGRKICKKPVMVSNYGGTAGGRTEIIWDMLRELGVDRKYITKANARLYSRILGDSIKGVLRGGKAFEQYIQRMNDVISKKNRPVNWETSDGFYIVHKKFKELKSKQVTCLLPGARKTTTINKKIFSDKLSPMKMRSAISPNYIHSLDAELLRRVALKMKRFSINDIDVIHDSFGCNPNHVDKMLEILKEEFRRIISNNPLKKLDEQLRLQTDNSNKTKKLLNNIEIPRLDNVYINDNYIDKVLKSYWFFS